MVKSVMKHAEQHVRVDIYDLMPSNGHAKLLVRPLKRHRSRATECKRGVPSIHGMVYGVHDIVLSAYFVVDSLIG